MANQITVTNNTSANPQYWEVGYTVDTAGLNVATLETAGTFLDRHIQVAVTVPAATFKTSGMDVLSSAAGWVDANVTVGSVGTSALTTGVLSATTAALVSPEAMMAATGFVTTTSGSYYVTLNADAGSVTPRAEVSTSGYVTNAQNVNGNAVSIPVVGNGDKLYIASNTITGIVHELSSGSVAITNSISGIVTTADSTNHSITIGKTITSGSVKGRAIAGNTTGIVASGTIDTSEASVITPTVTGTTTIYIPSAVHTLTGGGLSSGAGSASISVTSGFFNGTEYVYGDQVALSTAQASGYYKLQAIGSGKVIREAINSNITSGYADADTSSIALSTGTSNIAVVDYFLKKSTLSTASVSASNSDQSITVYSGYHPDDRTIVITGMTTGKVTPNYADTGLSTYFNTTASGGNVIITPRYTVNTSGYLATVTNSTANTTTARFNIKTTSINTTGITAVSGTTATRATASIASSGWITATTISAATFSNSATTGSSYVDISNTTDAPILDSSGFLYINRGYTDNLKISLARLIPNDANITSSATMLQGTTAYDSDGKLYTGSIVSKTSATYNTSSSDQTISSGQYLSGDQTIRAVTTSNITAANVKKGVTVKVGDSASAGRIINLTGTFTSAGTQSAGQTVATSAQMLSGYSAWVNGNEVKGNIATRTSANISVSNNTVTISSGYYSADVATTIGAGAYSADSSTSTNSTVTPSVTISSAASYGFTSSTLTGDYLTINPDATATDWSVTPRAKITTSGYLAIGNTTGSTVSGSPTIDTGTNWYVPIVTASFTGGTVTATINSNTISTNMATASTSDYYIDAVANGTYSRTAVTYTNAAGAIAAHSSATARSAVGTTNMTAKSATRIYIPEGEMIFDTSGSITTSGFSGTPTLTLNSNNNTNISSGISFGAQSTATYPYYFEVRGDTSAINGSTTFSIEERTAQVVEGYFTSSIQTIAEPINRSVEVEIASTSATKYINLTSATASLTGTNTVTPNSSMSGSNVTLSDIDNGIQITAVGGGTATVSVTAETNAAGYAAPSNILGTATFSASNTTTSASKYIYGVKLEAPTSGTRSFSIIVPNGSTTEFIEFIFTVDSDGNVTIAET